MPKHEEQGRNNRESNTHEYKRQKITRNIEHTCNDFDRRAQAGRKFDAGATTVRNCETCFQSPGRCRSCGILKVRADACDTGATKVRRNYEAVKIFNIDGQTPATQARQKFDEIAKLWKFSKSSGRRLRHRCDKNSRKFRNCEHLQHRRADACDTGATKVRRN